ncbi:MAG TPA: hypothetical protein VGA46_07915 [Methyloceanibacter sp.]|jgi:hypothetical protein
MAIDSTRDRELSLPEMFADPIVKALMVSDGVMAVELEELIDSAARRLGDRKPMAIADSSSRRCEPGHDRTPGR